MIIKLHRLLCRRCLKKWIPRREQFPVQCPGCKSKYWQEERGVKNDKK